MKREEIKGFEALEELALDLIWSWDHRADQIWRELDADLWSFTRNPILILQTVSIDKLERVLSNPTFCKLIAELKAADDRVHVEKAGWFQKKYPKSPLTAAAYFSMEYMLSENLPIYSGGLGNVAGDQLKAVNDLGVPVVGVGLLYQQGYFRQIIDKEGAQQAVYPFNSPEQLPVRPVRLPNGEWLRIEISLPGWKIWLRAWETRVGRVRLFLLDSNDASNYPPHRAITSELYGGSVEMRLKQEIVLGIGGWRLLMALGIHPEVCHLNEGHAAFAILERAHYFQTENKVPFATALAATRAGNLFTTHTSVPAGFDRFEPCLIEEYLGFYAKERLGISIDELLALGRENPKDGMEPFNMAYFAIRGSGAVNGVSLLHGKVSRQIFASIFPRWPLEEVPVGHVTNGVHMRTWDCVQSDDLWTEACGKDRWNLETECLEEKIRKLTDVQIWTMRNGARKEMIVYGRDRLARALEMRGAPAQDVEKIKGQFDFNTLTIGFARRFATYKRPNMLLQDPARLLRILTNKERPVQLVIAGKAHPADRGGQALIQQWMRFISQPEARDHVVFVPDYDMQVTERLVGGVDLWINTPRRPWEACGTSGMKVLVNGGLNLSELDGWWAEAYTPEVGWAIGDGKEHGEDLAWDAHEANQLYDLLENQVIPTFYKRDGKGIPIEWVARIRESMARLTPRYSANRAVRNYTEMYYLPAAENYRKRTANQCQIAQQLVKWREQVDQHWEKVHFVTFNVQTRGNQHLFEAHVYLDGLGPEAIRVELFANGTPLQKEEMKNTQKLDDSTYVYTAQIAASRPSRDFTPRAYPFFSGAAPALEAPQILWER